MAPLKNAGLKTEDQIPGLSIRDMISMATRQLHGSSRAIEGGFGIELRDYNSNLLVALELTKSEDPHGGTNLRITSSRLKDSRSVCMVNLVSIEHLYVTWETSGMISFCYAGDGRYKLVNVTHDNGVFIVEDMDRRTERKDSERMSESERRARSRRRTFYHIGTLFDRVEPHDPDKPLEGSIDAEERR